MISGKNFKFGLFSAKIRTIQFLVTRHENVIVTSDESRGSCWFFFFFFFFFWYQRKYETHTFPVVPRNYKKRRIYNENLGRGDTTLSVDGLQKCLQ